jgi:hypothetical protein
MCDDLARRSARALLSAAARITGVFTRSHAAQWDKLRHRLAAMSDGEMSDLTTTHNTLVEAARLVSRSEWPALMSQGHSSVYVREFEAMVRNAASQVDEFTRAAVVEISEKPIGDHIDNLQQIAIAMGSLRVDDDQIPRVSSLLLKNVDGPARSMGGTPHMLLQMGMSYASRPMRGAFRDAGGKDVLDGELAGSIPVHYDMDALIAGAPGTTTSGLGYRLVKALDTISEITLAEDMPPPPGATFYRQDAPGVLRPIASEWPLEVIKSGPRDDLAKYNRLAGFALDTDGFRLHNRDKIVQEIEHEGHELLARRGREAYQLDRMSPDTVADDGATKLAAARARATADKAELMLFDRDRSGTARELAITAIIDRSRLARGLALAMRHYTPGASGTAAAARARSDMLADDGASVKIGAMLHMI